MEAVLTPVRTKEDLLFEDSLRPRNFQEFVGQENVKANLKIFIKAACKRDEQLDHVLLYGPPGCGKTLLAKAVANESQANFISIKGPEVMSKWVGESEKAVRQIFKKAKQVAPAIVFLDEIDAIAPRRGTSSSDSGVTERLVNQLLTSIDGLESLEGVVIVGATNRPDIVDPALLRAGRFGRLVLIPVPDRDARLEIFKVHTRDMPLKGVNLDDLADRTDEFSGADIESLCKEAGLIALRKNPKASKVTAKDFEEALAKAHPSVDKETMEFYEMLGEFLEKGTVTKKERKDVQSMFR